MTTQIPIPFSELRAAFVSARSRAAKLDREFQLSYEDVLSLFKHQGGLCAISRLHFSKMRIEEAFVKHPFAPSLDRIDCAKGYTTGNTRLVCVAVNFGLGQWGEEVFRTIAEATVRNQPNLRVLRDSELAERVSAVEEVLPLLSPEEQKHQKRRLASLKRARTLGPEGLKRAAQRAVQKRRAA